MSEKLTYGTLTPAFGKDYKSAAEVEAAFRKGEDFVYNGPQGGGVYCSIRDFAPGADVGLRYKKLSLKTTVKV